MLCFHVAYLYVRKKLFKDSNTFIKDKRET